MLVLGISALDKDAHATIMDGDRVLAAVGEERLTRTKLQAGFPHRAVRECLRIAGVRPRELDAVAYPFWDWRREARAMLARAARVDPAGALRALRRCHALRREAERRAVTASGGPPVDAAGYDDFVRKPWSRVLLYRALAGTAAADAATHALLDARWLCDAVATHARAQRELEASLTALGLERKLVRVEHHAAHRANAFWASGFERALVVTIDAYGSGLSGSVAVADVERGIHSVVEFAFPHSLGLFYEHLTSALGFAPSRHEGKVLGLAAFGDPGVLRDVVRARFDVRDGRFTYAGAHNPYFPRLLATMFRKQDIAAAYQRVLEEVCTEVVGYHLARTGERNVVLSGGVTANVRLNQRIAALPGVEGVWVHPAMGDGGTGTGAAMHVLRARLGAAFRPARLRDVYLGPSYTRDEVVAALRAHGLAFREPADLAGEVARLIASGRVVARFDGRMEYGPRALGNRSILYHAREPAVNTWLNQRLGRTEFMPFAPVTLWEDRHRCYHRIDASAAAARFMTVTADCTPEMRRECPAAVHVDGTARPQLVDAETNPDYYAILRAYKHLTGIGSMINTSFNMHEEPIVCSPEDAVRAFRLGHLDALAMGPCLVLNPEHPNVAPSPARLARSGAGGPEPAVVQVDAAT